MSGRRGAVNRGGRPPTTGSRGRRFRNVADDQDKSDDRDLDIAVAMNAGNRSGANNDEDEDDAIEDDDVEDELNPSTEEPEPEGEDLFGETMMEDYRTLPEEDQYDEEGLDSNDYEPLAPDARVRAEAAIAARKKREAAERRADGAGDRERRGLPAALLASEDGSADGAARPSKRRRMRYRDVPSDVPSQDASSVGGAGAGAGAPGAGRSEDQEDEDVDEYSTEMELTAADVQGPLREWVLVESNRRGIASMFRRFLMRFVDSRGVSVYGERIARMAADNKAFLEVDFLHLSQAAPALALWVADAPAEMLRILDDVAIDVVLMSYPNYENIAPEIHVRLANLPVADSLRDIRQIHLNCLIRVSGVVTRRTSVFPQLRLVRYDCLRCGAALGPYAQNSAPGSNGGTDEVKPILCPNCQSKGPFAINMEQTVYRNYQKITLQESPGTVPAGRLPRSKEVILLGDLIDCARPGEEIDVTGILKNAYDSYLNARNGFPVFSTVLEANHVAKRNSFMQSAQQILDDDRREILRLSRDPRIAQRIISSIAPSIYGHEDIKTALALALFGGTAKNVKDKHRIRGDINVLLLGDPGTAKSQFLKYVEKTAHRAVFTTGRGSSAVGLTAAVHKDPVTREWTLEGGALVLADQGVCLIDEFDKMSDQDRTSIHEAMEQQSISISKAGIVTSLQARCSVMAAANPRSGRYDASLDFAHNVELTDPILSRFDVLCVVRDTVDPFEDEYLAMFVVNSHVRSHPNQKVRTTGGRPAATNNGYGGKTGLPEIERMLLAASRVANTDDLIPQEMLAKYIQYARAHCTPKLQDVNENKVTKLYSELRQQSITAGGMPISVRHIESIIRMAEAHARMHLRDFVRDEDFDLAIRVFLNTFIGAQKASVQKTMRQHFSRYMTYQKDHNVLLLVTLQNLIKEEMAYQNAVHGIPAESLEEVKVLRRELENKARDMNITDIGAFLESDLFKNNGFSVSDKWLLKKFDLTAA
nr:DNA replication licensing factor MCM2 [Andalucia godoyi]|eukprot:ANDGO_02571.mRNA.1 DNA replication licensing factor MCM2